MAKRKKDETEVTGDFLNLGELNMTGAPEITCTNDIDSEVVCIELKSTALGIHSLSGRVPEYATAGSACFDLSAWLVPGTKVAGYNRANEKVARQVKSDGRVFIEPGDRLLIPSGIHFDIPFGWELNIFARSGQALKNGLALANSVAVIDSDYVEQTFILLYNTSGVRQVIEDGERVAQASVSPVARIPMIQIFDKPGHKTDRKGGFGSTGTK